VYMKSNSVEVGCLDADPPRTAKPSLRGRLSLSHNVADWTNSKAQYRRHLLAINSGFSFLAGQLVKGPKS
jgi:hypothetical protein